MHIGKTYLDDTPRNSTDTGLLAKNTLQNQNLKVAEAMSDLSRMTGDFSLYSMSECECFDLIISLLTQVCQRVLSERRRIAKLLPAGSMYGLILVLRNVSPVLAAEVDRGTCLADQLLYQRVPYLFVSGLGCYKRVDVVCPCMFLTSCRYGWYIMYLTANRSTQILIAPGSGFELHRRLLTTIFGFVIHRLSF